MAERHTPKLMSGEEKYVNIIPLRQGQNMLTIAGNTFPQHLAQLQARCMCLLQDRQSRFQCTQYIHIIKMWMED